SVVEQNYPDFYSIVYSADVFIPLIDLGEERYWLPNSKTVISYEEDESGKGFPIGMIVYIMVLAERILGAVLMAIAVTGFTGILTSSDNAS
ncbi:MAG: hypothetical protein AAGA76_13575, partial [Pseudomonadota bacterium]